MWMYLFLLLAEVLCIIRCMNTGSDLHWWSVDSAPARSLLFFVVGAESNRLPACLNISFFGLHDHDARTSKMTNHPHYICHDDIDILRKSSCLCHVEKQSYPFQIKQHNDKNYYNKQTGLCLKQYRCTCVNCAHATTALHFTWTYTFDK